VNNFSELNSELIDEANEELDNKNLEEVKLILNDLKVNEGKINHHGKRAESIVKGMLLHSRGSSGKTEPTNINALCDEYLRLSYHGFRAKEKSCNADFKLELEEELPKISIVQQEIGRVLLNLINNAFYAVADKGRQGQKDYKPLVEVQTRKLKDKIEIRIKDNGNGIPDSIKGKIFQPFFSTKPTGAGTGLGLSISYDIITKGHNGSLKVNSEEGHGTEFIIEIPITS
jgi:signal transduction histidine kinase